MRCAVPTATRWPGFSPLIDLPVVWFALYGRMRDVWLAVFGGALTLALPVLIVGSPQFPDTSWRGYLLLVIISAAIGPLIHRLVTTTTASNRALQRSEAEFRATFENAPIPIAVTGLHGADAYRWLRVNRAMCELFGRSAEELTSRQDHRLHPSRRPGADRGAVRARARPRLPASHREAVPAQVGTARSGRRCRTRS